MGPWVHESMSPWVHGEVTREPMNNPWTHEPMDLWTFLTTALAVPVLASTAAPAC